MKRLLPFLFVFVLAACSPTTQVESEQTMPSPTAVSTTNFTRIDLPNDLQPRGVSDDWYAASPMGGGALYLIDIASGQRTVISENGGGGAVVVTQTAVSWIDDAGQVQQYNIVSGETRQVTQEPAERLNLVGNDRWLVWQDKRNETGEANYYAADIYAYDLSTGEEIAVAVADGVQQQPALFNDLVVWADNRNSPVRGEPLEGCGNCPDNPFDIYSFNLQTGETAVLAAGGKHNAQPAISYNRVAWITFGEGIKVLDLNTGVVETAVPYQEGLERPWLFGNQLGYLVRQACDVMMVDETGQEIKANWGAFLLDLATHETSQLTGYKEPSVLLNRANVLIAEGCMIGFDAVYLLQNVHPASPPFSADSLPVAVTRVMMTAVPPSAAPTTKTTPVDVTAVPESIESQLNLLDLKAELTQTPTVIPTVVSSPLSPTTGSKLIEIARMIETAVPNPAWSTFNSDALQFSLQYPSGWQIVEQDGFVYLLSDERLGEGPEPLRYFVYIGEYPNPDNLPFPDAINAAFDVEFPTITTFEKTAVGPYQAYVTTDLPSAEGALSVLVAGNGRYLNLGLTPFQVDQPYPEQERFVSIFGEILASLQLNDTSSHLGQ